MKTPQSPKARTSVSASGVIHPSDSAFMDRALELAAHGLAEASPNPMVGAVIVREGQGSSEIVSEGFHKFERRDHAEIVALKAAGAAAKGATLYVNLEPCCHVGRTGPCTKAITASGIVRVVAAMSDPNPRVAGQGFAELREAGVEVVTGVREAEAQLLNEAFSRWIVARQPLVTLKSAMTLDGQLSLPGNNGRGKKSSAKRTRATEHRWISSPESRAEVQRLRHSSDALLTGIGTVLADDPQFTDRTGLRRRRKLLRVVLDSRLRLPVRSKLIQSADHDVIVFTRAETNSPKARALQRAGAEVVRLPGRGSRPPLAAVIDELGRRDILSVLLESGPALNSAALSAGIVDKMCVFVAPVLAGFAGVPLAGSGLASALQLQNVTVTPFGPDFAFEGYLRDVYRTR